jgi:hypothetical protein
MNRFEKLFLLAVLVVCFSCEEKGWFADCDNCTPDEPSVTDLIIKLGDADKPVIINIYEGELEDSLIYNIIEVHNNISEYKTSVSVNKRYTITATYEFDGITYIAVDSALPSVKYSEDQCEEACYFVYDKEVDLRLKYTVKQN